eukprot:358164-Chlamydomonas_euryale.AAC.8
MCPLAVRVDSQLGTSRMTSCACLFVCALETHKQVACIFWLAVGNLAAMSLRVLAGCVRRRAGWRPSFPPFRCAWLQVTALSSADAEHKDLYNKRSRAHVPEERGTGAGNVSGPADDRGEASAAAPAPHRPPARSGSPPAPLRRLRDTLAFVRVQLDAPDGTPLVRDLSFEVWGRGCV